MDSGPYIEGRSTPAFNRVLTAAIEDMTEHGYDDPARVALWMARLREAIEASLLPQEKAQRMLSEGFRAIYRSLIERGAVFQRHPGIEQWTIHNVAPALRAALDRRILASAELIRLNRQEMIEKTLRRFAGWATSIPVGGTAEPEKREAKKDIRKALARLPFEERRVHIDQGHKLVSSLSEIVAVGGGAIAGVWHSHWRTPGYAFREDHKERDQHVYLLRDSWAKDKGFVKVGPDGYVDDITKPAEEPFCFPGDSRVPFAEDVEIAYRRWYSGDLTELVTATGKTLRATPNHPILTARGWVAAGSLHEGDYLIEVADDRVEAIISEPHNDDAIPSISKIFGAAEKLGIRERVGGSRHQFHGDGTDSNVDIVRAARHLRFDSVTSRAQRVCNISLSVSGFGRSTAGALGFLGDAARAAAASIMSLLDETLSPRLAFAGHANEISLRSVAEWDAKLQELPGDIAARDEQSFGQREQTFPFAVRASRLTKVNRSRFSGHVYNLQTAAGWYVTEGIVVHNCRCFYTWLYSLRDIKRVAPEMLTAKGREQIELARAA